MFALRSAQHELQELADALAQLRNKLSVAQNDVLLMREERVNCTISVFVILLSVIIMLI